MIINGVKTYYNNNYYEIGVSRKEHIQKFLKEIGFSIVRKQLGLRKHEKVSIEGKYVEPYKLIERGLFKLPFLLATLSNQYTGFSISSYSFLIPKPMFIKNLCLYITGLIKEVGNGRCPEKFL